MKDLAEQLLEIQLNTAKELSDLVDNVDYDMVVTQYHDTDLQRIFLHMSDALSQAITFLEINEDSDLVLINKLDSSRVKCLSIVNTLIQKEG